MYWFMREEHIKKLESKYGAVIGLQIPEVKSKTRPPVTVNDGVAVIPIRGMLMEKSDPWLDFWGEEYTVYSDIRDEISAAVDKGAEQIDFEINSPGGQAFGLYETMVQVSSLGVKTRAIGSGMVCSGAYMIASQTDEILAASPMTVFGSVGMATCTVLSDKIVDITNTGSEDKRPDPKTEHGIQVVKAELDDMFKPILEMIGNGRRVPSYEVLDRFGNGRIMAAGTALSCGMIDGWNKSDETSSNTVDSNGGGMVECNENLELTGEEEMPDNTEATQVNEAEIRAEADKVAKVAAEKSAVKSFMAAMPSMPKHVMDLGMDVLTGDIEASEFYAAVAEIEKTEASAEQAASEVESAEPVAAQEQKVKNEKDPFVIHDMDSFLANKNDFRRG